jgi:CubicO group peptidase (beta-lactamase class C family)
MGERWVRWLALVAVAGILAAACSGGDGGDGDTTAPGGDSTAASGGNDTAGAVPGAEWTVEEPEDHGIDPAGLEEARSYAFAEGRNTQSLLVVHEGAIVGEWYADGEDQDSWGASWSMAKSVTSALVGIAIEQGHIPGVDEPMTTWFPEWAEDPDDPRADMTLRHVLQMSSGLDWDEIYEDGDIAASEVATMVLSQPDQLADAAARPPENEPGTVWSYSSGDTMLLSSVLEQATGMPVHEYAQQVLFDPLGMEQIEWWRDAEGHTLTYCCLDAISRDFARFGLLYLHEGRWGDEQVVPTSWVEDSLEPAPHSNDEYGYQWWLTDVEGVPTEMFAAQGHDGQFIYVVPSLDLVVVRNGLYTKHEGEPVADPNLFGYYPSGGLVEDQGTTPPDEWDAAALLSPIVAALGS